MSSAIQKRFGKRVRQLRHERNMSQERLGELAKLHRTYIGMVERAEKNISLTGIEKIAKALKVPVSKLLE